MVLTTYVFGLNSQCCLYRDGAVARHYHNKMEASTCLIIIIIIVLARYEAIENKVNSFFMISKIMVCIIIIIMFELHIIPPDVAYHLTKKYVSPPETPRCHSEHALLCIIAASCAAE